MPASTNSILIYRFLVCNFQVLLSVKGGHWDLAGYHVNILCCLWKVVTEISVAITSIFFVVVCERWSLGSRWLSRQYSLLIVKGGHWHLAGYHVNILCCCLWKVVTGISLAITSIFFGVVCERWSLGSRWLSCQYSLLLSVTGGHWDLGGYHVNILCCCLWQVVTGISVAIM